MLSNQQVAQSTDLKKNAGQKLSHSVWPVISMWRSLSADTTRLRDRGVFTQEAIDGVFSGIP
jgi:hypothetical protein